MTDSPDDRAVFELDGEQLVPSALARGPWYPGTQHGSAMLGLLARAIERHPSSRSAQVVRFTADMMRAAPMAPVTTATRVVRTGRSMEILEARLEADGETFARASAVRFRIEGIDVANQTPRYGTGRFALPAIGELPRAPELPTGGAVAFHHALEFRPALGSEAPAVWFRVKCPLVAGETLSPFVRVALTADWTYSVPFMHQIFAHGGAEDPPDRRFSTINPDTSINLHRPMQGQWLCLDSHIHYDDLGAGSAMAYLQDEQGPIGHASQCILIRGADKRPSLEEQGASENTDAELSR
jgi:hypothetical protein